MPYNPAEGLSVQLYRLPLYAILFAAMLWTLRTVQRSTTHTGCAASLLLCLFGWALLITTPIFRAAADYSEHAMGIALLIMGSGILCMIAALVVGVASLVHLRRHRDRYTQGMVQAIAAIMMSLTILPPICLLFIRLYAEQM